MRLLTTFSAIATTGALANHMAMPVAYSSASSAMVMEPAASAMMMEDSTSAMMMEPATSAMMMEASTSAMMYEAATPTMMSDAATSTAMMYGAATSAAMMHDTTAMALAEETSSMMYETTPMAAAYTASMAPPMAQAGVMTHTVVVGGTAGLVYTPDQITAAVNDVVHFVFMSQNHTVTQSSFPKPCNKLSADAIDSGFMSNPNNTVVPAPTFDYTVTSTDPTWWYCKQRVGTHCGKGMVFAINPTLEKNFDTFKAAAISINGTAAATATTTTDAAATAVGTVTLVAGSSAAAVTTSLVTDAVATATAAPIVAGWNEGGASCQCACFCGVSAYPSGDGIGAYGGYGGSLPAPW